MKQIIGTKVGMATLFDTLGKALAVTVVSCEPNKVIGTTGKDYHGYNLTKIAYDSREKEKHMNKAQKGIFDKSGVGLSSKIRTIKQSNEYKTGDEIKVDSFEVGDWVDVQGTTKGRGFTGAIFRWNKKIGTMSHGHGYLHRWQGSLAYGRGGSAAQRVKKGAHMGGHYGDEAQTMQNLNVVKVDVENNLIFISGSIPGPKGSLVLIKESVKPHKTKPNFKLVTKEYVTANKNASIADLKAQAHADAENAKKEAKKK